MILRIMRSPCGRQFHRSDGLGLEASSVARGPLTSLWLRRAPGEVPSSGPVEDA